MQTRTGSQKAVFVEAPITVSFGGPPMEGGENAKKGKKRKKKVQRVFSSRAGLSRKIGGVLACGRGGGWPQEGKQGKKAK